MAQRYGADGEFAEPGRVPGVPHPAYYGGGRHARDDDGIDHGGWTGAAEEPPPTDEPPPISGALVQQHRTLPHGELRADFGAHLETHYPRLVAQLYAITLNPQEAHDAVQDAYSRAWRRWNDLRDLDEDPVHGHEDPAVGWVRRVAIRTSMRGRFLRRRRRPAAEDTDPRTGALLEALGRLGPADRRAVVLHHMAGLPAAAVAELEGVGEQEIRRRLVRGREVVTEGMAEVLEEIVGAPVEAAPYVDGGHTRVVEGGRA
ncbi:RNA polymerase sigma factor [Pseudonocardia sp. C8]|uniref:RNA polymerase sigma factor n=1 Tax=Pseudonocardia sp. C8 TaxID=2762759 RepID=UPI00351BF6FF